LRYGECTGCPTLCGKLHRDLSLPKQRPQVNQVDPYSFLSPWETGMGAEARQAAIRVIYKVVVLLSVQTSYEEISTGTASAD
jgi:hypothetical protein